MNPQELQLITSCTPADAALFADAITKAMKLFSIDTPKRQAAFLAQVTHESGRLRWVRELATGAAYEGRADLGNIVQGDGVRFKGRGLLQTTGRANYRELNKKLVAAGYEDVPDFEKFPQHLEQAEWAAASAGLYWATRKLNALADNGDFTTLTRRINGGTNGLEDRLKCWAKAKAVLCT